MRPRQQITELFSTFLQFEADHFEWWITDARLRRQMQRLLQQLQMAEAPTSERFWVMYWHKRWQEQHQPADLHLTAYLQESCYWAAQQTVRKFADLQYGLSDCFQIAITEVNSVVKGFNPERGASLKTYGSMAFSSILRDALRQRQIVDLCSNWTLLRRISKKRLLEAFTYGGLADTMPQYQLAWVCFKTLYVPNPASGLPKLDAAFWEKVADLYNAQRQQMITPGNAINAATIERWLTQTAGWVRAYLYPAVGSLNTPKFGEDTTEVQDLLAAEGADSLLSQLVAEEETTDRVNQQAQLNQALSNAITKLDSQSQEILRLYYQQGLTQQQIMRELALSQASVSRRLSKARENLLSATVQWSQSLNIVVNPALIKEMSTALDEWLNLRYQPSGAAPST
jgi:RNA polymerase sigma factor (sigma-70 family)